MNLAYQVREVLRRYGPLTWEGILARVGKYVPSSQAARQKKVNHSTNMAERVASGRSKLVNGTIHLMLSRGFIRREGNLYHFVRHSGARNNREKLTLHQRLRDTVARLAPCTIEAVVQECERYVPREVAWRTLVAESRNKQEMSVNGVPKWIPSAVLKAGRRRFIMKSVRKMIQRGQILKEENYLRPGRSHSLQAAAGKKRRGISTRKVEGTLPQQDE